MPSGRPAHRLSPAPSGLFARRRARSLAALLPRRLPIRSGEGAPWGAAQLRQKGKRTKRKKQSLVTNADAKLGYRPVVPLGIVARCPNLLPLFELNRDGPSPGPCARPRAHT